MRHIRAKVFPGYKSEKIEELGDDRYKIYLREPAANNAANKRLVIALAEYLEIEPNKLRIISGHHFQNKTIEIIE